MSIKSEIIKKQSYTNKKMVLKIKNYRKLVKFKDRTIKNFENSMNILSESNLDLLKKIEKQDKIIDLMAEKIDEFNDDLGADCFIPREYSDINDCIKKESCKKCVIEYFTKKVEKEGK